MTDAQKKWTIFGTLAAVIAGGTWFFVGVSKAPHSAPTNAPTASSPIAPAEDRDHEKKMLAKELEKKPDHIPVLLRLAQLAREAGQVDMAIGYLRRAVGHEPGNLEARLELGRALYEKGDVPGAISETQKILVSSPNNVDALYNMGAIYANQGDAVKARSYWTAAIAAAPNTDSGAKARDGLRQLADEGVPPKG